jgi:phosphohistidine phosphatase SixA
MSDEWDTIILTGHNPPVSDLAAAFSELNESLKPAEALAIHFNTRSWADIGFDCTCRFISPYAAIS